MNKPKASTVSSLDDTHDRQDPWKLALKLERRVSTLVDDFSELEKRLADLEKPKKSRS